MQLFCFGLGYAAKAVADNLSSKWKISGTHTNSSQLKENEYAFNDEISFANSVLDEVTHLLISIPPSEAGDLVYLRFANYLKTLKNLKWVGYFSSSSVYGDHQGNWVNELSSTNAFEALGKNRLLAEKQWLASGLPVNILRLTGIYGPGRSAIEAVRAGRAMRIIKENHYFSRIHVQDLAKMTIALMKSPRLNEIYNIADDQPSPNHQVVAFACKLMNIEPPEKINFQEASLSTAMANYYQASKKVDNSKIKQDYKLKLTFPSYREGLENIFNG
jgi:nucleoside-diphosphate-sugar epimerase